MPIVLTDTETGKRWKHVGMRISRPGDWVLTAHGTVWQIEGNFTSPEPWHRLEPLPDQELGEYERNGNWCVATAGVKCSGECGGDDLIDAIAKADPGCYACSLIQQEASELGAIKPKEPGGYYARETVVYDPNGEIIVESTKEWAAQALVDRLNKLQRLVREGGG